MSTDVVARPNVPPVIVDQVYQAVGAASMQWEHVDQAGTFKSEQAAQIAGELCVAIERAWDARERPLHAHLRNLSYNLGQLESIAKVNPHLTAAREAVDNIISQLEGAR